MNAWIDYNQDGDWDDSGEQIFTNEALVVGANSLATPEVPYTALTGDTFARFRVSSAGGLAPTGLAQDGEVEDYKITIGTHDPTVTVTSDVNPSVFGQLVTFEATVADGLTRPTPTGTVEFVIDGGTAIPVVLDGNGKTTTSTSSLALGPHNVVANYLGDATYSAGSDSLTQNVNAASTMITITADAPDPSIAGQDITVEWVVSAVAPGAGTPTGTVTLSDGVDSAGPFNVADGLGALALTTTGSRTITATYTSDTANYSGDTETESHQVNPVPTSLVVDLATDVNNGSLVPGDVELREAINLIASGGTITFAPSLAGQTIELDNTNQGPISILRSVTIDGTGVNPTVDANGVERVFTIADGTATDLTVEMISLALTGGTSTGLGGGIYSSEDLTLSGMTIFGNTAHSGGGIGSEGALTMVDSTVRDNSVTNVGGGLGSTGPVVLRNCTVSNNSSQNQAGAFQAQGVTHIINSTISSNTALGSGGGILTVFTPSVNIINSTITNNTADSDNSGAGNGGGIFVATGTISLQNTIVAGNFDTPNNAGSGTLEPDVHGDFVGNKTNLIGDLTGSTGFGASEDLGALGVTVAETLSATLQDNGGPTLTHELVVGSPAIDGGTDAFAVDELASPLRTDQRGTGFPRIALTSVDVGAIEFQCDPTAITDDPDDATVCEGSDVLFTTTASGTPTPTVQWQVDDGTGFVDIGGQTGFDLQLTGVDASMNGYQYRAVYTNPCATENTAAATLTVNTTPVVSLDPVGQTGCEFGVATFTAQATGQPTPGIQWQVDEGVGFADLTGENNEDLILTNLSTAMDGFRYRAVFTSTCGSDTSAAATLTVNTAPMITEHPQDMEGCLGGTVTFTSAATGTPAPTPQWQVDDGSGFVDLPGETNPALTIDVTADKDGNQYRCGWGNGCGVDFSSAATLTVVSEPIITIVKSSVFFGPFLTSNFVSATDGALSGRVHITWSAVDGATEYRVFRAEKPDLSDAVAVSGWITDVYFDDYTIEYQEAQIFMCPKTIVPILYHYYVVARNSCFDSEGSTADSGWATPRQVGEHTQRALPAAHAPDGKTVVGQGDTITVRISAQEAIRPEAVSGVIRAESPLNLAGVAFWPVAGDDWSDVWVSYTPQVPWQAGEEITFTVAAQTVSGQMIAPISYGFRVGGIKLAKNAPMEQPGYDLIDTSTLDLEAESMGETKVYAWGDSDVPAFDGQVGGAYFVSGTAPFTKNQRVWLPVPQGVSPEMLEPYYLKVDNGAEQWVPGHAMRNWLVTGSETLISFEGTTYYGFLVSHGGTVQLGAHSLTEADPAPSGVVNVRYSNLAAVEWGALLALLTLMWLVARRRRQWWSKERGG